MSGMQRMYEDALARVASKHFSVVEVKELAEHRCWGPDGTMHTFGRPRVRDLVRSGRLVRLHYGVYRLAGAVESVHTHLYAAIAAAGTWAAASHLSGLALHDLPGGDLARMEIVAQRHRRKGGPSSRPARARRGKWRTPRSSPSAHVHETYLMDKVDFTERHGIPVTTVARTLCDAGESVRLGDLDADTLTLAIQDALRRNLTSLEQLGATFERLGGRLRPGAIEFERALGRFIPQMLRAASSAELRLIGILHEHGYLDVETQHAVRVGSEKMVLDTFLPSLRVVPEFDSYRWHGGRLRHDRDGSRTLQLASIHIMRLPVTDAELDAGCPQLLRALEARKAELAAADDAA